MRVPSAVYLIINLILVFVSIYLGSITGHGLIKAIKYCLDIVMTVEGSVMAFVILQRVFNNYKAGKFIVRFSALSMGIYLIHEQLVYVCLRLFEGLINPYLFVVVTFICVITVSTLFTALMSKTRVTRFLIGSK